MVLESTQGEEKPSTSYLPLPLPLPLPLHPITKKTTIHIISRSDSDDDDDRSHEEGKHGFEFVWEMELRWSATLNSLSNDIDTPIHDDVDVPEMEEKEKVVRHMWDVYTNSHCRVRFSRFWQEVFKDAYGFDERCR
ncbi:hypothetical protein JHK85_006976 [Glycine max]|nr:hypothetical protein JHK85_006976 [Glycine max]